jgi:hypothetical protein
MAPPASMKATDSGSGVFFIHMQYGSAASNTNSMAPLGASDVRCMSPRVRVASLSAISARIRCMPAPSCTTGSGGAWAAAPAATNSRAAARERMGKEKGAG